MLKRTTVGVMLVALASVARAQVCNWWVQAQPGARSSAVAVFDPGAGNVVMYGGSPAGGPGGPWSETWLWNGRSWTQHVGTSPSARSGAAVAFDIGAGAVVLFGGSQGGGNGLADTWLFRESEWRLVADSGPSARGGAAMCYDTVRQEIILFGGSGASGYSSETWSWDGATWRLLASAGPLPRTGAKIAFDEHRGVAVLFGGSGAAGTFAGTWEWDGAAWTLRAEAGPGPRGGSTVYYDPVRQRVMLSAGRISTPNGPRCFGDLWSWDGTAWRLESDGGPARYGHAAAFDTARNELVMTGGTTCTADVPADTWTHRPNGWARVADGEMPRGKSVVFHPRLNASVFVGGTGGDTYGTVPGVWTWNGEHANFYPSAFAADPGNEPMVVLPVTYDSARDRVLAYTSTEYGGRMWEWQGGVWTLRELSPVPLEASTPIVYDSRRNVTVLFGGDLRASLKSSNTWEYDGTRWRLRTPAGPTPTGRANHMLAFDSDRGVMVMFGGERDGAPGLLGDTWEYNGVAWEHRSSGGPSPRSNASMTYDTARRRVVLTGGSPSGNGNETWEWDGATWMLRSRGAPGYLYRGSMAYDPSRQRTVAAGMDNDQRVWEMAFPSPDCAADFNGDDFVDFFDYDDFVASFERAGERADFNHDCFIDFFDYDAFVEAFETGC
jgi:hypothetical protein